MTRQRLTHEQLAAAYAEAQKSGALYYPEHSRKLRCAVCGKSGYHGGTWYESCAIGHPYVCDCGRKFSTGQAFAHHTRGFRWNNGCPIWKEKHAKEAQASIH